MFPGDRAVFKPGAPFGMPPRPPTNLCCWRLLVELKPELGALNLPEFVLYILFFVSMLKPAGVLAVLPPFASLEEIPLLDFGAPPFDCVEAACCNRSACYWLGDKMPVWPKPPVPEFPNCKFPSTDCWITMFEFLTMKLLPDPKLNYKVFGC